MKLHCTSAPQAIIVLARLRELDKRTDAMNEGEAIRVSHISASVLGRLTIEFPDIDVDRSSRVQGTIDVLPHVKDCSNDKDTRTDGTSIGPHHQDQAR